MNGQCTIDQWQLTNRDVHTPEMTIPVVIESRLPSQGILENNDIDEDIRCLMESGTSCQWIAEFGLDYHVRISSTSSESMFFNIRCAEMEHSFIRLNDLDWIINAGLAAFILGVVIGIIRKVTKVSAKAKNE